MSSLLKMITDQLGSGGLNEMSAKLGVDESTTGKAVAAALPMLLGGLAKNASDSSGANALSAALDRDHDGSIMDDMAGFLGGGAGGKQADGAGILKHVFGSREKAVENGVGKSSGMSAASAASLMAMLAPMEMGALGKAKRQNNMDAQQLAGMLGNEKKEIEREAPQEMNLLNAFLDSDGDGDVDLGDLAKKGLSLFGKLGGGR